MGGKGEEGGWSSEKRFDLQAGDGAPVWIGRCVVRDRLDLSARVQVYRQKCYPEVGILGVDAVHVRYCADEGWDVDLIEIQAPDVVQASFRTGEAASIESGRRFKVFPRNHGDVLLIGLKI